ncbi:hypothetical protein CJD36_016790 [Flavipsychrobacter stenotrophus]|uniref:Uncharacterized protein n=1 Tax=Flavipsychrobacter stenotrophus TaxID=2077091 RepID=A0A2S7SSU0_9BACT|nr:hypothetical protein [Flavipsychrobacter stenotrophus]PQJ09596.1 hypothetical protein CJD36_016790 [Flavipsychrobacter stenotrophus]
MPNQEMVLSDKLMEKLNSFNKDHDSLRISRSLRKVFFDYLRFQNAGLSTDFDTVIEDVDTLIQLMELFADETISRPML